MLHKENGADAWIPGQRDAGGGTIQQKEEGVGVIIIIPLCWLMNKHITSELSDWESGVQVQKQNFSVGGMDQGKMNQEGIAEQKELVWDRVEALAPSTLPGYIACI